jgi:hypothetical protein
MRPAGSSTHVASTGPGCTQNTRGDDVGDDRRQLVAEALRGGSMRRSRRSERLDSAGCIHVRAQRLIVILDEGTPLSCLPLAQFLAGRSTNRRRTSSLPSTASARHLEPVLGGWMTTGRGSGGVVASVDKRDPSVTTGGNDAQSVPARGRISEDSLAT